MEVHDVRSQPDHDVTQARSCPSHLGRPDGAREADVDRGKAREVCTEVCRVRRACNPDVVTSVLQHRHLWCQEGSCGVFDSGDVQYAWWSAHGWADLLERQTVPSRAVRLK